MMKSINFKQPKYQLPLVILPFLILLIFVFSSFGSDKQPQKERKKEVTHNINPKIPGAEKDFEKIKGKWEAVTALNRDREKEIGEFKNIGIEEEGNSFEVDSSLIIADSLKHEAEKMDAQIQSQIQALSQLDDKEDNNINNNLSRQNNGQILPIENNNLSIEEQVAAQMAALDSMNTAAQKKRNVRKENGNDFKEKISTEKESIATIEKDNNTVTNRTAFNSTTSNKNEVESNNIIAMVDKAVLVKIGSRVKLKLRENAILNVEDKKIKVKKGQIIYGIVSGFSNQRVLLKVSSIVIDNKVFKTNIKVYYTDGFEGIYVPGSDFREITKNIGSKTAAQNIRIEQQNQELSLEQVALNAMNEAYRSTSQAVSKIIRRNKARLKYNTKVILVNDEN